MRRGLEPFIWECSSPGRVGVNLPPAAPIRTAGAGSGQPGDPLAGLPPELVRAELDLPELSEPEVVRHFTRLSQLNFSVDTNFYPLGSCTMKYNPKLNEAAAALEGFSRLHPLAPEFLAQGALELMHRLQAALAEIAGFEAVSLQPAAGAQGELAGVLMIRAYHRGRGDEGRVKMLIPDSAHGTNPATVGMAGLEAVSLPSDRRGNVDLDALAARLGADTAGIMITNPNTLGLFEESIEEVIGLVHAAGGLVYGDGANMNALLGVLKPGALGVDVMHFNLHKTFSTPHGGGGPGAGPVGTGALLAPYLPGPVVVEAPGAGGPPRYGFSMPERSIGRLKAFHGNFGMLARAYAYIRSLGAEGLRAVADNAVLNANYLKHLVASRFPAAYDRTCMHEFVSSGAVNEHVHTIDVAKRLIDHGFHPPTVYFPLIVREALMIEPTETESRETLESFAAALLAIAAEADADPALLKRAPHDTPVGRLDEVRAAREPVLRRGSGKRSDSR